MPLHRVEPQIDRDNTLYTFSNSMSQSTSV